MRSADKPLVSVIMPAHNAEAFLEDAIYSIVNQTYTNWELLIINDSSTDSTSKLLAGIKDERIRVFENTQRQGAHNSRNTGIKNARGEFIALLDSDDIALPQRLEKQVNFLLDHPEIDAVSGGYIRFGDNVNDLPLLSSTNPEYIRACLILRNPIVTPALMVRKKSIIKYGFSFKNVDFGCEDYDLWLYLSFTKFKFNNIKEVQIKYRKHAKQTTVEYQKIRSEILKKYFQNNLAQLFNMEVDDSEMNVIYNFTCSRILVDEATFNLLNHFLNTLYMRNNELRVYSPLYFNATLYFYYLRLAKYHFAEYKKKPLLFLKFTARAIFKLGLRSLYIFLRNDPSYFQKY